MGGPLTHLRAHPLTSPPTSAQGWDFDGFNLMWKPALRDKPAQLVAAAKGAAGTAAVNTNGWLKSAVAVRFRVPWL